MVTPVTDEATRHPNVEASKSVIAVVPRAPLGHALPESLATDAERRHDADTGDDDARAAGVTHHRSYNRPDTRAMR